MLSTSAVPSSQQSSMSSPPQLPSGKTPFFSPGKAAHDDQDDDDTDDELEHSDGFRIRGRLKTAPEEHTMTIRELHSLIHEGTIDLNPPYQRDVVWPAAKQALLIDSLLRDYWIPPVVFAIVMDEDDVPTRVCVDGKQRLTSIQRFLDGQLPYIQSRKQHYYFTSPESTKGHRLQIPDDVKQEFVSKEIRYVEYSDLGPGTEREIFQRVQMGMSLTPAEKMAAIDSPWAEWISLLETRHVSVDGGLSQVLDVNTKRGRDYQNVAQLVYCCDGYPAENVPTAPKMMDWLSRIDKPGEQFKQDIENVLNDFGRIAVERDLKMGFNIRKRLAPVEFVFIGVLLYVIRRATDKEKASAIYHLRTDIREQFLDVRMNSNVGAALWTIINHLKTSPTTSISEPGPTTYKRKRQMSEDSDYRPTPIKSLGHSVKTRSRR